ncbi:response regulator [Waterburya agarophytonicola K14]|uniref:Response regulator n=1 Tax=Waterburya agarophytonicola KI4 TaxID=2874699 RepID=A0A964BW70_9CYAN|nr:response regulator [Waterburya agarophytonicola]MCC0179333.1 response regulator [Waterburya agarophytonicola KI4]
MIFALLNNLKKQSFTGIAHIRTKEESDRIHWKVYFNRGKLIWANGGLHNNRSWQRHLNKYCSEVDLKQINFRNSQQYRCADYHTLGIFLQRNMTTQNSITQLVASKVTESFFDIFQQEKSTPLELEEEALSLSDLIGDSSDYPVISIDIEVAFKQMQQQWSAWIKDGFTSVFPDYAPRIKSKEKLKLSVPSVVYQNFTQLLDGHRSLRDLAIGMNKDLLLLTKSIYPYIHKELLELVKVPDLNLSQTTSNNVVKTPINSNESSLIACIDDSPQICQIMNQIITRANYSFLGIQQPIQAVPKLISVNPKMVFLDIGMPILNGYEVCTQIRRVSKLQKVPIIMLTGNDGVFDRVKAKVCGASDFLSKPIEVDKILQTIDKFSAPNAPSVMKSSS